jgi:hypothetical protein
MLKRRWNLASKGKWALRVCQFLHSKWQSKQNIETAFVVK